MKALLEHLYFIAQYLSEADLETVIGVFLIDLGFPAGRPSFEYIKTAVVLYAGNPEQLLFYELYPEVARKCGRKTKMQVEIAMRREIHRLWQKRDEGKWNLYFPSGITTREKGPSNAELLSGMLQVLEVWEGCCENYRKKAREQSEETAKL